MLDPLASAGPLLHKFRLPSWGNDESTVKLANGLYYGEASNYVTLCEVVFRQITLSKREQTCMFLRHKAISWGSCLCILSQIGMRLADPFGRTNTNTQTHCVVHSSGRRLRSKASCLPASDTLRFHNRRASHECAHTECTLCRSERMTDCCATHFRTTLRNLIVPPVCDPWLVGIPVGVCPKTAKVKGDLK